MSKTLDLRVIRWICLKTEEITMADSSSLKCCRICGDVFHKSKAVKLDVSGVKFQFHIECLATSLNQLVTIEQGYGTDAQTKLLNERINTLETLGGTLCLN